MIEKYVVTPTQNVPANAEYFRNEAVETRLVLYERINTEEQVVAYERDKHQYLAEGKILNVEPLKLGCIGITYRFSPV